MLVLLTGGAGFIGRHVLAALLDDGYDVRVLDSLRADVHTGPTWLPPAGVELQIGDVRDCEAVDRALSGVELVVHLAAKVGLGVSVADLPDYASSNDVGTAQLLTGMARADVSQLTLASSMVVYGEGLGECAEHGQLPPAPRREEELARGNFDAPCPRCGRSLAATLVSEDAPIDPRNAYASSKYAQEMYAGNWARATGGTVAVLRYHNVYGPGMPRDTPYAGVAAIFTSALRSGRAPQVFEDGAQRRDFVHVRDVARATSKASELHRGELAREGLDRSGLPGAGLDRGQSRAFNVGSATPRTVGEMAAALALAMNGPAPVITGRYRLGDVRHITADSARVASELGWSAQVDFATGMRELAQARLNHTAD